VKRELLKEWIEAVNGTGNFDVWFNDVSYLVADKDEIIKRYL
jgi:hypothetical protein